MTPMIDLCMENQTMEFMMLIAQMTFLRGHVFVRVHRGYQLRQKVVISGEGTVTKRD